MPNHDAKWKEEIDYYGVLSDAKEVDSDVNEDDNREALLDDSVEAYLSSIEDGVRRKHELTNVPGNSVFDAAADMDDTPLS